MDEERGVSLREIFSIIFKRVWWLVGAMAACLVIFVLVVQFAYNPSKKTYSVNYNIEYPDSESGQYPDGTAFRLSDVIKLSTLNSIIAGDDELKDIDVSAMTSADDISIAKVAATTTTEEYITITVKAKYFSSSEQVTKFIKAVAEYPISNINDQVETSEYSSNLTAFSSAKTYDEQITLLQSQVQYIDDMYADLIELYGQYYKVNGKSLLSYRLELNNIISEDDITQLQSELATKYYTKDGEKYLTSAQIEIDGYNKQIADNNKKIEALREERDKISGSQSDVETFNQAIVTLVTQNSELQLKIESIENKVAVINSDDKTAQTAFEKKLNNYADSLQSATDTFKDVRIAVYGEKSVVIYNTNRIEADGGLNIILAAVIGVVVGFIVAAVIICAIDMPKYLKKRDEELAANAAANKQIDKQ
jgi:hypothetical protein